MRRRRKNRKKQAQGFVFPMPLALFLVMATVTSMAYLWMHGRCEAAGQRIVQLERQEQQTRQRALDEELKWTRMRALPRVVAAVERHGLNMSWATSDRIVQLPRPRGIDDPLPVGDLAQAAGERYE